MKLIKNIKKYFSQKNEANIRRELKGRALNYDEEQDIYQVLHYNERLMYIELPKSKMWINLNGKPHNLKEPAVSPVKHFRLTQVKTAWFLDGWEHNDPKDMTTKELLEYTKKRKEYKERYSK